MAESKIKQPVVTIQTTVGSATFRKAGNVVFVSIPDDNTASSKAIGTIPVGYRPSSNIRVPNYDGTGHVFFGTDGECTMVSNISGTAYFPTYCAVYLAE